MKLEKKIEEIIINQWDLFEHEFYGKPPDSMTMYSLIHEQIKRIIKKLIEQVKNGSLNITCPYCGSSYNSREDIEI